LAHIQEVWFNYQVSALPSTVSRNVLTAR
jgi:hypothetical protein